MWKKRSEDVLVAAIEECVIKLLTIVRKKKGIQKKQLITSAIEDWVSGKLDISDVEWIDEESRQFSAAIDGDLKRKFDNKIDKINGVKSIILSLIIKKWIDENYPELVENDVEMDIL